MLKQFLLVSTPTPADGVTRYLGPWLAPHKVSIRRIRTWIGSAGQLSDNPRFPSIDVYATVFVNGLVGSFFGLDHYDNFTGPHQWPEDYGKDELTMEKGQAVTVGYAGTTLAPDMTSSVHVQVIVWYEEAGGAKAFQ
jgi:hypothetical protein